MKNLQNYLEWSDNSLNKGNAIIKGASMRDQTPCLATSKSRVRIDSIFQVGDDILINSSILSVEYNYPSIFSILFYLNIIVLSITKIFRIDTPIREFENIPFYDVLSDMYSHEQFCKFPFNTKLKIISYVNGELVPSIKVLDEQKNEEWVLPLLLSIYVKHLFLEKHD